MQYTGVIGIVFQQGTPDKFLLIHNIKTGNRTFVAGGKEKYDNSPLDTLHRELKEETGLDTADYKVIETGIFHEFVYNSKKAERTGQKATQPVFLVETEKENLVPEDPDAKIEGWFTEEALLERLTFDDMKDVFRAVKNKIDNG
ncbi:NUDIX hydrolase [Candidatus Woesearchaeota archaeon]|nr:NUDIX hydrolase [Candidatus Woesearchaeota archaeon]